MTTKQKILKIQNETTLVTHVKKKRENGLGLLNVIRGAKRVVANQRLAPSKGETVGVVVVVKTEIPEERVRAAG